MAWREAEVGDEVAVRGLARSALSGACVVDPERRPVYVAGLERWDASIEGRTILATGRLDRHEPVPAIVTGEPAEGITGSTWVLDHASWAIPLEPADNLLAWLEATAGRSVIVPLVLDEGDLSFGVSSARLGSGPGALIVYANDAALGVGLTVRARAPFGSGAARAFLVEARWLGMVDGRFQLDVLRVVADLSATAVPLHVEAGRIGD